MDDKNEKRESITKSLRNSNNLQEQTMGKSFLNNENKIACRLDVNLMPPEKDKRGTARF